MDFCLFAPAAAALGSQAARWRAHPVPTDRCGARCSIGVACESPTAAQLALCSLGNLGRRARAERGWARDDAPVDQKGAFAIRTATATRTATCRSFTRGMHGDTIFGENDTSARLASEVLAQVVPPLYNYPCSPARINIFDCGGYQLSHWPVTGKTHIKRLRARCQFRASWRAYNPPGHGPPSAHRRRGPG